MVKLFDKSMYLVNGELFEDITQFNFSKEEIQDAYKGTISYSIIKAHNTVITEKSKPVKIKFDALASHDITYVGIIQTAKASGLKKFPIPYVLTNCHNSLCAVGGTINEDDHVFGLSAAKKYGGIYVPAHQAVIHTYMREEMAGCSKMILGSDSHTRYGALGTMAIGEGGPELVKQLLEKTYDINYPDIIGVQLKGKPRKGVGPQDVALAIIGKVFKSGFVKNKVMEFFGEGISNLSIDYRNGIDVMTTETTCLSSIWVTDNATKEYLTKHNRPQDYSALNPQPLALYDGIIEVDLDKIEPMIALPFHPSNVYTIRELKENPMKILAECEERGRALLNNPDIKFNLTDKIKDGKIRIDQAIVAGCAGGTYDNIAEISNMLQGQSIPNDINFSVYPGSQPIFLDLVKNGAIATLMQAGATIKTAFCGPCFGAGDVPQNNGFSIRHTTRNFEAREGSKPSEKQIASVALMDARSIAATVMSGGELTSAMEIEYNNSIKEFEYDSSVYKNRIFKGFEKGTFNAELVYGPNIKDWPEMVELQDNLIMKVTAVINDEVTTTDELIPSGETSSYRSNPLRLAEFTLSRKCSDYVSLSKAVDVYEQNRRKGNETEEILKAIVLAGGITGTYEIGSVIYANKPGDGSAREQAASCQRVLGGIANIAKEYATKRYRSNLINWGMIPFIYDNSIPLEKNDIIIVKDVHSLFKNLSIAAYIVRDEKVSEITLKIDALTDNETQIIKKGSLINYNKLN